MIAFGTLSSVFDLITFAILAQTMLARAEVECEEPMADWQPVSKLVETVTAQGWTVLKVRADDGCYHLRATDQDGKPVEAIFDPVSLHLLATGNDDHEHDNEHGGAKHGAPKQGDD